MVRLSVSLGLGYKLSAQLYTSQVKLSFFIFILQGHLFQMGHSLAPAGFSPHPSDQFKSCSATFPNQNRTPSRSNVCAPSSSLPGATLGAGFYLVHFACSSLVGCRRRLVTGLSNWNLKGNLEQSLGTRRVQRPSSAIPCPEARLSTHKLSYRLLCALRTERNTVPNVGKTHTMRLLGLAALSALELQGRCILSCTEGS